MAIEEVAVQRHAVRAAAAQSNMEAEQGEDRSMIDELEEEKLPAPKFVLKVDVIDTGMGISSANQ